MNDDMAPLNDDMDPKKMMDAMLNHVPLSHLVDGFVRAVGEEHAKQLLADMIGLTGVCAPGPLRTALALLGGVLVSAAYGTLDKAKKSGADKPTHYGLPVMSSEDDKGNRVVVFWSDSDVAPVDVANYIVQQAKHHESDTIPVANPSADPRVDPRYTPGSN